MKKILFATTALVATAGVAAADVSFGGYGRFGVRYVEVGGVSNTNTASRLRLTITGTTESDNGLSFGARVRIQQTNRSAATPPAPFGTGTNQARFWVSTNGLTVAVGNLFGVMDSMPNLYIGQHGGSIGTEGLGYGHVVTAFASHTYSSGGSGSAGGDGVEVTYSADAYTVHVSSGNNRTEFGGSYNFGDWTVGLAGADDNALTNQTRWLATVGGTIGSVNVRAAVSENLDAIGVSHTNYNLSAGFAVGAATTLTAYVAEVNAGSNYGIGVNHDLGGGASIAAGVASLGARTDGTRPADITIAELGVIFNF